MMRSHPFEGVARARTGLTLIELLVVTAIIGVVAGLSLPVAAKIQAKGRAAAEVSAARNAMQAFHAYSADHAGRILPGYGRFEATDQNGDPISFPASGRYPWRLAPYFDFDFRAIYVNAGEERLARLGLDNTYGLSVSPSFGMNVNFVGGDYEQLHPIGLSAYYGPFCVTRVGQAEEPSNLIVFASARSDVGSTLVEGYYRINPPNMTRPMWRADYSEGAPAASFGFVHPRHEGRAVVAMLDGHVEMLDTTELRDMRRWSDQAARADDPDWTLRPVDK